MGYRSTTERGEDTITHAISRKWPLLEDRSYRICGAAYGTVIKELWDGSIGQVNQWFHGL
jgi:hypothetical protein